MVGFVCYHRRGFSWGDGIVTGGFVEIFAFDLLCLIYLHCLGRGLCDTGFFVFDLPALVWGYISRFTRAVLEV